MPYPGSRDIMRQVLALKGMPEDSLDIAVSSLSDSSVRQYETTYRKWWSYCKKNRIGVFTDSIPNILSFLMKEFHNGASYGTINSYRLHLGTENRSGRQNQKILQRRLEKTSAEAKIQLDMGPKGRARFLIQMDTEQRVIPGEIFEKARHVTRSDNRP